MDKFRVNFLLLLTILYTIMSCVTGTYDQQPVLNGTCNSFDMEVFNEGNKPCVYNDHLGSPIIGVKFNLEREDAKQSWRMAKIEADFSLVRTGTACLSNDQIRRLFHHDMMVAVQCASKWLSSAWSRMSIDQQSAIADMAFSMGCSRLKTFKKMKAALQRQDYRRAEDEMVDSRWCRQVRTRCVRATDCMKQK